MVYEFHDLRMVCFLKAVTPFKFAFALAIDYIRYCVSFDNLQAKAKCIHFGKDWSRLA